MYVEGAAVDRLCAVLAAEEDPEVVRHVAAALGSLAYGSDAHAAAVCQRPCVEALAQRLDSGDEAVLAACAQSLKILYQRGDPPVTALFDSQADIMHRLVQCLHMTPAVSVSATALLAA